MNILQNIIPKIKNFFVWIWKYAQKHKIKSSIALIIILVAGYFGYNYLFNKTSNETRYILASVTNGTITTSVSGTGQVSAKEERDIKAKTSGEITYLNATSGQSVSKGTLLATIDTTQAKKSIQEAEENLESAQISLQKLIGADESNPRNKQEAQEDLTKAYEDGYNTVSTVFLDLPSIMKGLDDILYGNTFNNYQDNIDYYNFVTYTYDERVTQYKDSAAASYKTARASYDKNFQDYKSSNRYSDTATVDALITQTYNTSKDIAQSIKDTINLIQFHEDTLTYYNLKINSTADTHITSLSSYLSKANSDISSLFNITSTIKNDKQALEDTDSDIRTAKLTVTQKERALQEAKDALSDNYIYAPFNGIISTLNILKGDDVSSGTTVGTIITQSKIAEITLSESDIANIKVGNKATLTFDAIENLTVDGEVTAVDSVGAASSGVVSYGLEIAFDTDNESVKPGMSTSATIATNSKENVLTVPTTAVKSRNDGTYYVQVLGEIYDLTNRASLIKGVTSTTPPTIKIVTIGLADDTNTEITSGLSEGDQVVVRVSTSTTTSSSSSSSSSTKNSTSGTIRVNGGMMQAGGPPQ
jgi:HlyD family secretion protein